MTESKVDVTKIAVGDRVAVWQTVTQIDPSDANRPVYTDAGYWPDPDDIALHEPRGIQISDTVKWGESDYRYEVRAIDGDSIWLLRDNTRFSARLEDLTRVTGETA